MASTYPIDRSYRVTTTDNGNFLNIGNAASGRVGTWLVHWVPDLSFAGGGLTVYGRGYGKPASDAGVPWATIPYRRINVAGVASDYAIVTATVGAAGMIQIPANGLAVALGVSCTAGFGWLYSWDLNGPSAV